MSDEADSPDHVAPTPAEVTAVVRRHAGVTGKEAITAVSRHLDVADPLHGPGDDGAVVELEGARAVVCGEAIAPAFVRRDPYGAGVAAVLANVNDVAAMGGVPLAVVDTVVGRTDQSEEILRGMTDAARMYDIAIVGGHLTRHDGEPALSAFALGEVRAPLSMAAVAPGQAVLLLACLRGRMRADFPFFTTLEHQCDTLARDVRLLARAAEEGLVVAAKDVSMAGPLGSLAMLLEFRRYGARVDLDRIPVPAGADPLAWLVSFPSYAFWLTTPPERVAACRALFEEHALTCVQVGEVAEHGRLTVFSGAREELLMDLATETVTGLWA